MCHLVCVCVGLYLCVCVCVCGQLNKCSLPSKSRTISPWYTDQVIKAPGCITLTLEKVFSYHSPELLGYFPWLLLYYFPAVIRDGSEYRGTTVPLTCFLRYFTHYTVSTAGGATII